MLPIQLAELSETQTPSAPLAGPPRRIALELNPISTLSLYRPSATLEISIADRLALNFTPSVELALVAGVFGEVGLRDYSGALSGFFVGVSALGGIVSHRCEDSAVTPQRNRVRRSGGPRLPMDHSAHRRHRSRRGRAALALAHRLRCLWTEIEQALVVPSVATTGVLPRFQFGIGYARAS